MVNLLVVALLLTSCLAELVDLSIQLRCKTQDGGGQELLYEKAVIRTVEDGIGMRNTSSGYTMDSLPFHNDIKRFEHRSFDLSFSEEIHIPDGQKVEIVFHISCSKEYRYRTRCPGVDNLCTGSHKKLIPIVLDYNNLRNQLKGRVYYVLATATRHELVAGSDEFDRKPMTKEEYCAVPAGMNITCNFREWPAASSPELNFAAHFLCKKRDGSYIPLAKNVIYLRFSRSGLGIRKIGQEYGIDYDMQKESTDDNGKINFLETFFKVGHGEILVNVECGDFRGENAYKTYRDECPSIEKICSANSKSQKIETYQISVPFDELKKFNGGYFALTAANRFNLVLSKSELNTEPIDDSGYVEEDPFE